MAEQLRIAERDVNPRIAIPPAGFEQQHAVAPRLRKPGGDGATGRSGAGHDEVEPAVVEHRITAVELPRSVA